MSTLAEKKKQLRAAIGVGAAHGANSVIAMLSEDDLDRVLARASVLRVKTTRAITEGARELCQVNGRRSVPGYPPEYDGPKPLGQQIEMLATPFSLDPTEALKFAKHLPRLKSFVPRDALEWVGWFAVLSPQSLLKGDSAVSGSAEEFKQHCVVVRQLLDTIGSMRPFVNFRKGMITPERIRANGNTTGAMSLLRAKQKGPILLVPAQLGMWHLGRSVSDVRQRFVTGEFGLGIVAGASIVLTHPERFGPGHLPMDLPGDNLNEPHEENGFGRAAFFDHNPDPGGDELLFGSHPCEDRTSKVCAPATAFVPPA